MDTAKFLLAAAALMVLSIVLAGCGTRPSQLNPPAGRQARDLYPAVYPAARTVDPNQTAVNPAPAPYAPVTSPGPGPSDCSDCQAGSPP